MTKKIILFGSVFFMIVIPLWPQSAPQDKQDEQLSFIGLKLDELIQRFGPPQTVYTARGEENWQDDVVFAYNEGDFYIYRDRVWQIGIKTVFGIKIGDSKSVAMLIFGENALDEGDYIVYSLPGRAWPLSVRVNCNAGKVSAIYIYRPDY